MSLEGPVWLLSDASYDIWNGHRCSFGTFLELFSIWVIHSHKRTTTCWCMKSSPTNNTGLFHFLKTWVRRWQKQYFNISLYILFRLLLFFTLVNIQTHLMPLKILNFHVILCFPAMKMKFCLNEAVGSPHIPPHPLHPLESSCQTQVQTLLSSDFHKASYVPETLHGVFFRNMKDWLDTRVYCIIYDLRFHWYWKN